AVLGVRRQARAGGGRPRRGPARGRGGQPRHQPPDPVLDDEDLGRRVLGGAGGRAGRPGGGRPGAVAPPCGRRHRRARRALARRRGRCRAAVGAEHHRRRGAHRPGRVPRGGAGGGAGPVPALRLLVWPAAVWVALWGDPTVANVTAGLVVAVVLAAAFPPARPA